MSASTVYDSWFHQPTGWDYVGKGTLAWLGTQDLPTGIIYLRRLPAGTQVTAKTIQKVPGRQVYDIWICEGSFWKYIAKNPLAWFGSQKNLQTGMYSLLRS